MGTINTDTKVLLGRWHRPGCTSLFFSSSSILALLSFVSFSSSLGSQLARAGTREPWDSNCRYCIISSSLLFCCLPTTHFLVLAPSFQDSWFIFLDGGRGCAECVWLCVRLAQAFGGTRCWEKWQGPANVAVFVQPGRCWCTCSRVLFVGFAFSSMVSDTPLQPRCKLDNLTPWQNDS